MRFFREVKKYAAYMRYAAYASLKAQVAGSYLNWFWWILEPFGMMIVFSVIFGWLFKQRIQYFPAFIFIGNTIWWFFSRTTTHSVLLIKWQETLLTRIYIPKHVLVITEMLINGFQMLIQFGLTACLLLFYRIPVSIHILWLIPILIALFLFTFGISSLLMNCGVYVMDLEPAMNIIITVWMYFSGIFFDIRSMIPAPYSSIMLAINPIGYFITAIRDCVMYNRTPDLRLLVVWLGLGLVLSFTGIRTIYKNENDYIKRI